MYGKTHTKEDKTREKIKQWIVNGGFTQEQIEKMRKRSSGEKNPNAKLSEEDVKNIKLLFNNKSNSRLELSIKYNVKISAIDKIISGKTWKHIT